MASSYEEKRAELKATAEGGIAGRQAYKQGRERLVSDQRAAIDAALAGPVRFGEGTADRLRSIIQPSAEAGLARIDHAGERHGTSMGELDTYLDRALAQQGGARKLNYSTRLADAKLDTDRQIEMGEIQRRKAAEDLWRRNEEAARLRAEREAAQGGGGSASDRYTTEGAQKRAAEALGGAQHAADLDAQRQAAQKKLSDDLVALGKEAFAGLTPEQISGYTRRMVTMRDDPEAIAALIREKSPAYREEADSLLSAGFDAIKNLGRRAADKPLIVPRLQNPVANRKVEGGIGDYAEYLDLAGQQERQLEVDRYLYNQDAYTALFDDPLLAAGIFPQSFEPVEEATDFFGSANDYISTGMTGKELTQARERENEAMIANLASGAGLSPKIIDSTLDRLPVDATEVYAMLGDENTAGVISEAVSGAVAASRESLGSSTKSKQDLAANTAAAAVQEALAGADPQYVEALALIASEQARIYAKVGSPSDPAGG